MNTQEEQGEVVSLSTPRLNALEKLYVRTYLHTLSHIKAHKAVAPSLASHSNDNTYSRKDSVQFHINLVLQEKAEALTISPEVVLERLWKEGIREGAGSNHAARIQALVQLGKHLGMFVEKKESTAHTFNIITYSDPKEEKIKVEVEKVNNEIEVEENKVLSTISFTDYGDE